LVEFAYSSAVLLLFTFEVYGLPADYYLPGFTLPVRFERTSLNFYRLIILCFLSIF